MEIVKGYKLDKFLYQNLKKVSDLIYYDGPLLSHFYNVEEENNYFYYWVDNDHKYNRWLIFRVTEHDLANYLNSNENLLGLIYSSNNEFLTLVDIDFDINYQNTMIIKVNDLPTAYVPENDSYYKLPIPDIYSGLIKKYEPTNYLDVLKQKGLFLKLSTKEKEKYGGTIDALTASNLLQSISKSYQNYAKASFHKHFSYKYLSIEKLNSAIISIIDRTRLRCVGLEFASFGVGLAADFINEPDIDKDIYEWKKRVLINYSDDILETDYSLEASISMIESEFTPEQRNEIFRPIINLLKNNNYELSITDQEFKTRKKIKKITKNIEEKILTKLIEQPDSSHAEKEIINIVIEKPKYQPLNKITGKNIQDGLLFSQTVNDFTIQLDKITNGNQSIDLVQTFIINVTFDNIYYHINIPELSINVSNDNKEQLLTDLNRRFFNQISYLQSNSEDQLSEIDKLKKLFWKSYIQYL